MHDQNVTNMHYREGPARPSVRAWSDFAQHPCYQGHSDIVKAIAEEVHHEIAVERGEVILVESDSEAEGLSCSEKLVMLR